MGLFTSSGECSSATQMKRMQAGLCLIRMRVRVVCVRCSDARIFRLVAHTGHQRTAKWRESLCTSVQRVWWRGIVQTEHVSADYAYNMPQGVSFHTEHVCQLTRGSSGPVRSLKRKREDVDRKVNVWRTKSKKWQAMVSSCEKQWLQKKDGRL